MQVPAQFEYDKATSVDDAIAMLTRYGPESFVVAGGHSLLPMMKLRLAEPETLIDINGLDELATISVESGAGADRRDGPAQRPALLAGDRGALPDLRRRRASDRRSHRAQPGHRRRLALPGRSLGGPLRRLLGDAGHRGHPRARSGERRVPVREFHRGPYETAVGHEELLVAVDVPILAGSSSAYAKLERRAGDWAVASAGAMLRLDGDTVAEVGIGLSAVGAPHFVAPEAEEYVRGGPATDDAFVEAGRIAAAALLAQRRPARPRGLQAPSRRRAHDPGAAPRSAPLPRGRGLTCRSP